MSTQLPQFSLIIPAYRCQTLDQDLHKILTVCDRLNLDYEVLCVLDGRASRFDKTLELATSVHHPALRIFFHSKNQGKGYAVRQGFKHARGNIIGFMDAGNDIEATDLIPALTVFQKSGADIVVGSKNHLDSQIASPWQRKLYSSVLQRLTHLCFGINCSDTQAGLKLFKGELIRTVLPELTINRWAFDIELLYIAQKIRKLQLIEVPIHLTYNYKSNIDTSALVNFFSDFWKFYLNIKKQEVMERIGIKSAKTSRRQTAETSYADTVSTTPHTLSK